MNMELATEAEDKYAKFLMNLQQQEKLSAGDLNKVRRMQKSAMSASLPQHRPVTRSVGRSGARPSSVRAAAVTGTFWNVVNL